MKTRKPHAYVTNTNLSSPIDSIVQVEENVSLIVVILKRKLSIQEKRVLKSKLNLCNLPFDFRKLAPCLIHINGEEKAFKFIKKPNREKFYLTCYANNIAKIVSALGVDFSSKNPIANSSIKQVWDPKVFGSVTTTDVSLRKASSCPVKFTK